MDIIIYAVKIKNRQSKLQVDNRHDAKVFWLLGCTVISQVRSVYKGMRTYPAGRPKQYHINERPIELDTALDMVFEDDAERKDKWNNNYSKYVKKQEAQSWI